MNDLQLLKELISKGENFSKDLHTKPIVHINAHRIREKNQRYLTDLIEWKTTAIQVLKTCSLAESSSYLKDFENEINKTTEMSGEFYKENVSSATGVLKSLLFFVEKDEKRRSN